LNNLEGWLVSWIGLLGLYDFGVKLLTDLLRNGSAINLGGCHCDGSARESSLLGVVSKGEKGGRELYKWGG
jgi:hypothetical protein